MPKSSACMNNEELMSDIACANKPAGWLTHTDGHERGFVEEYYSDHKISHRLDRDTSGCLLLAKTQTAAAFLTDLFQARQIQKTYLFVTDKNSASDEFSVSSYLEKKSGRVHSHPNGSKSDLAITHFKILQSFERFSLWQAMPETGKTHQIRVHAAEKGIAILGDTLYGGSPFERVLLHCLSMEFNGQSFSQPAPLIMTELKWLSDPLLARWVAQLDRRQRLHPEVLKDSNQTLRIAHDKEHTVYNIDRLGQVAWFYRFLETPTSDRELKSIEKMSEVLGCERFVLRQMHNRGTQPLRVAEEIRSWTAIENSQKYKIKEEQGWSPGLFLDQRANRAWVHQNSQGLKVLNLFAYTAGFSVCAAMGGAREVTTVDTSGKTLDWAKENFQLNDLNPQDHLFYKMDAREFLRYGKKKNQLFDLVICDPPSFARNKKELFKIEREMTPLLEATSQVLTPGGRVLFSCNYEKWPQKDFLKQVPMKFKQIKSPSPFGDYEKPGQAPIMKTVLLQKPAQ